MANTLGATAGGLAEKSFGDEEITYSFLPLV